MEKQLSMLDDAERIGKDMLEALRLAKDYYDKGNKDEYHASVFLALHYCRYVNGTLQSLERLVAGVPAPIIG